MNVNANLELRALPRLSLMEPPPPKSPAKPPLITPSASPPPLRYGGHVHRTESAPPLKRQRTTSTPRPMTPSASQDPIDVLEQRKASTMRLLDFWDSLARYTRPLDEDDLVDVLTGEITKDVGVLRNSTKFNFGSLAAPVVDYTSDEGSDTHEELDEDEYGVDELDAFQDDISEAGAPCGLDVGAKIMPLVTPLGPADADDLREFMEAEQKRRELYGSVDGEDDEDYGRKAVETDEEPGYETPRYSDDPGTLAGTNEDEREEEEVEEEAEGEEEEAEEESSATYGNNADYVVPLDAASDDELDNWDTNATNAVHPVTKQEPENDDDNDTDIEIIDVSPAPKPSQSHKNDRIIRGTSSKRSERTPKPPHQLYTPPQSNSSSGPSATPTNENFIDLSTESTPSPSSSASGSSPVQSPSKKSSKRQAKNEGNHAFQSETAVDSVKRVQETPVRRVDLSKIRKSSSPVKGTPKRSELSKSSPSKSNGRTPNLKPFVLLTPRKAGSPQKPTTVSRSARTQSEHSPIGSPNISKGKGKAKQAMEETKNHKPTAEAKVQLSPIKRKPLQPTPIEPSPAYEDNDSINIPSSSPSKPLRSHLSKQQDDEEFFFDTRCTPEVPTSRDMSENQQFLSPTFPSPPTYRKRKRTPSDVSMESPDSNRREVVFSIGKRHPFDISNRRMSTARFSEGEGSSKHSPAKRRSSSRARPRTPEWESGSESDESDVSNQAHHRRSRPPTNANPPSSYSYPAPHPPYPAAHHAHPHGYAPVPDPRAQLIITQAMQQLSALVGAPWIPPHQYHDERVPRTPSHRRTNSRPPANPPFRTPTHPHPYSYSYDPNLSHATLPPDSPDESSPQKPSASRRKSLVRRSRSKGRRVSFHLQDEEDDHTYDAEVRHSSPSDRRFSSVVSRQDEPVDRPRLEDRSKSFKGMGRAHTPYHPDSDPEYHRHSDTDLRGRSSRTRGQTPGPSFESSRASMRGEHNQHSSGSRPEKQGSRRKRRED